MANELRFKGGSLLFVDDELAMSDDCCCGAYDPWSLTLLNLPDNAFGLSNVHGLRFSPITDPHNRFLCFDADGTVSLPPYRAYSTLEYSLANGTYPIGVFNSVPFAWNKDGGMQYRFYDGANLQNEITVNDFTYLELSVFGSYSGPGSATITVKYYQKRTSAAYNPSTNHDSVIAQWRKIVAINAGETLPALGSVTLDITNYDTSRAPVSSHRASQYSDYPCTPIVTGQVPDYYPQAVLTF